MSFEGKNLYGQYIDYSEKKKWPKGFICPYTGTIFYIIRIYSRSQVSVYRTIGPLVYLFIYYFFLRISISKLLVHEFTFSESFATRTFSLHGSKVSNISEK